MRTDARRQLVDVLSALGVVAALAGLALGLPATDRGLPSQRPVEPGKPYPIGAGVTVVPPGDATVDVSVTRPGDDAGTALFRLGPVQYAISVRPFDGDLPTAADRLRQRITGTGGYQVTGAQLTVHTGDGMPGLQGGYTAPGRGGRYAVFVGGGLTIEVTISGSDIDLGRRLADLEASTHTLRRTPR
jgi:hypothetical protein